MCVLYTQLNYGLLGKKYTASQLYFLIPLTNNYYVSTTVPVAGNIIRNKNKVPLLAALIFGVGRQTLNKKIYDNGSECYEEKK